jgi:hypothetical protein
MHAVGADCSYLSVAMKPMRFSMFWARMSSPSVNGGCGGRPAHRPHKPTATARCHAHRPPLADGRCFAWRGAERKTQSITNRRSQTAPRTQRYAPVSQSGGLWMISGVHESVHILRQVQCGGSRIFDFKN